MNLTVSGILSWLIIGALAGSIAGMIVKRKKAGWDIWSILLSD